MHVRTHAPSHPRTCALVASAILTCAQVLSAQQPPATFKAEVDYVQLDAAVTDTQGNFIGDLAIGDFEIYEDGKPQKIELFSYVDLPIERPDRLAFGGRPIPSDVKSNQQSLGRLYVIVLDDLNTSLFRTDTVKRTARRFVERHLGTNDVAAVIYTSGRADASQDFTSDPSLLLTSIDKFVGRKLRSAAFDRIDAYYQQQERAAFAAAARDPDAGPASGNSGSASSGSSTDPRINPYTRGDGYPDRTFDSDDLERGHRAVRVLEELKTLSDFMANIHGRRKAVLLFSEGIDYATTDIFGAHNATDVVRATQDAITAAARGNVGFFAIDPRGLVGMSADAIALDSPGPGGDAAAVAANLSGFAAEMRVSQDSLRTLAEETGGFASIGANDPSTAFDRIVSANSRYYVLGYYPPVHPRDGRFHKIEVRVKRPGARVSARKGYATSRRGKPSADGRPSRVEGGADNTTAELRAMLNGPMQQQRGVPMLVQAAPFKESVAVAIEIDSTRFRFEPRPSTFDDKLELSYFSVNEQGRPLQGLRRELELSLRPETYERARQAGLRISERLQLAPGRHQLRIGVREVGSGALGTIFYDLRVPDFAREPLSISGILLTAASSSIVPTLIADTTIGADLLPAPATSRRTFAEGDELAMYAEIYDNLPPAIRSVAVTTRLLNEAGREVFRSRETHQRSVQPPNRGTTTVGLSKRIALKDVPQGRYLLQVEARTDGNSKDSITTLRETVLTVTSR